MEIYTIGFTQKTAAEFFGALRKHGVKRLLDVRLNNSSQLSGFAKRDDLSFFLKEICHADYLHEKLLAPRQDMLDSYKKKNGAWSDYEREFLRLMSNRKVEQVLLPSFFEIPTALLCSEATAANCHRRLVLEYLRDKWGIAISVVHL